MVVLGVQTLDLKELIMKESEDLDNKDTWYLVIKTDTYARGRPGKGRLGGGNITASLSKRDMTNTSWD